MNGIFLLSLFESIKILYTIFIIKSSKKQEIADTGIAESILRLYAPFPKGERRFDRRFLEGTGSRIK